MLVALDTVTGDAVAGSDLDGHYDPGPDSATAGRYECLLCGSDLSHESDPGGGPVDYFQHHTEECLNDGNSSDVHRIAQELVMKTVVNWLPYPVESITPALEKQIGTRSSFVISDVCVSAPVQIGAEIFYTASRIDLRRRLSTLFNNGYAVLLIFLTNGRLSPTQVEHYLNQADISKVGRLDPYTFEVQLGSVLGPDTIDPRTLDTTSMPGYIV
jgi:hypothetical protein